MSRFFQTFQRLIDDKEEKEERLNPLIEPPRHTNCSQITLAGPDKNGPVLFDVSCSFTGKIAVVGESADITIYSNLDTTPVSPKKTVIKSAHRSGIACAIWSSLYLATGAKDGTIKLWDAESLQLRLEIKGAHERGVAKMAWSHGESELISAGEDFEIKCWDVVNQQRKWTITQAHTSHITGLVFHQIEQKFISVSHDKSIKEYNMETIPTLPTYNHNPTEADLLNPKTNTFAYSSLPNPRVIEEAHTAWITDVISPSNTDHCSTKAKTKEIFITTSQDKCIRIWSWQSFECIRSITHSHLSYPTAIAHAGANFVTTSATQSIKIWSYASFECQHVIKLAHSSYISGVAAFSPSMIVSIAKDSSVKTWSTKYAVEKIQVCEPAPQMAKAFTASASSEGGFYLARANHIRVFRWSETKVGARPIETLSNKKPIRRLLYPVSADGKVSASKEYPIFSLAVTPKYYVLGEAQAINFTVVAEGENQTVIEKTLPSATPVRGISFFKNYQYFLTCSDDMKINIYETETLKLLGSVKDAHNERIRCVAVNAEGTIALTGANDETFKIWSLEQGPDQTFNIELADTFTLDHAVAGATFSPLGHSFAYMSKDGCVSIFSVEKDPSTKRIKTQRIGWIHDAHPRQKNPSFIEYSCLGQGIYTGDKYGGIRYWPLDLTPLMCSSVSNLFNYAEANRLEYFVKKINLCKDSSIEDAVDTFFNNLKIDHGELSTVSAKEEGPPSHLTLEGLIATHKLQHKSGDSPIPTILALQVPILSSKGGEGSASTHICVGPGGFAGELLNKFGSDTISGRDFILLLIAWFPWLLLSHSFTKQTLFHRSILTRDIQLLTTLTSAVKKTMDHYILPFNEERPATDILTFAIDSNDDDATEHLLEYISSCQGYQPVGTQISTDHIKALLKQRPAIISAFLSHLKLAKVSPLVIGNVTAVCMEANPVVLASPVLDPPKLWPKWVEEAQMQKKTKKKSLKKSEEEEEDEIGEDDEEIDEVLLKEYSVIPGVVGITNFSRDKEFLALAVDSHYSDAMLSSELVSHLITFKWSQYGKKIHSTETLIYLSYLLCYCAFLYFVTVFHDNDDDLGLFSLVAITGITTLLLTIRLALRELTQMLSSGFLDHWKDFWNILDGSMLGLALASPILLISADRGPIAPSLKFAEEINALAVACMWFKLLYYGRAFKAYGALIRMLFEIVDGMKTFLGVLLIAMVGFGMAFYVLLHRSEDSEFSNPMNTILACYTMMLGDFDTDSFENGIGTTLFVLYMFVVFIIMLNVVIAIIGDTYDEVIQKQDVKYKSELAALFVEMELFIDYTQEGEKKHDLRLRLENPLLMLKKLTIRFGRFMWSRHYLPANKFNPAWLHVLSPVLKEEESSGNEWKGRVSAITEIFKTRLGEMEARYNHRLVSLEKKLANFENNSVQTELKLNAILQRLETFERPNQRHPHDPQDPSH